MNKPSEFSTRHRRRRDVLNAVAAAAAAASVPWNSAFGQEKLSGRGEVVVFSYGGSYTQALRKTVYEPFTRATGITVVDVTADYAEPQVKAMKHAGRTDWDIAIIDGLYLPELRNSSMFVPIDYGLWDDESLKGVPQAARLSDAVVAYQTTTVLAYNERAFPKGGPRNWADFWNLKDFPGPRGLASKWSQLDIPLAADGVPGTQIWPLTDDKLQRAFRKLDEIKPHVPKWWTAGGEPVQALLNREYAMTSCFDGRALAAIRQGAPLRIVWERGNIGSGYFTILAGGPNSGNAQKFLAYVNRAKVAANFTLGTNSAAPNLNQLQYMPENVASILSIYPENRLKLVPRDDGWLSTKRSDGKANYEHVQRAYLAWRARG